MTDGPMGIQVAPTEDEMNHVQDILKRALNAVVGMSQLQADVDMLRNTVQALQADTERLRQQNAGLDEALYQSRNARNELTTRLAQAEHDRDAAKQDTTRLIHEVDATNDENNQLRDKLHNAEQRADNAELRVMELEDELKAANAKLATIQNALGIAQAQPEPAKPVEPASVPAFPWNEPTEANAAQAAVRPSRTYLDQWETGAIWDSEENQYYREEMPF